MSMPPDLATALAARYLAAERAAAPIAIIREEFPDLTEDDVYAVQAALVAAKVAAGGVIVGRKCGATNPGAMANFGLSQAVYGTLFADGQVAEGGTIAMAGLIHPRLECEVAFRLGSDLAGPGVTAEQALAAVAGALAAFEIVDARTAAWGAKMPEMIADNVFQARYVLGHTLCAAGDLDLAALGVVLTKNGQEAARATGANVLGNPLNSLAWLANRLADHGLGLRAGAIVLAGSLTPLVPIAAGDTFAAAFEHLGTIRVSFS